MHDLTYLIHKWENSALELREAETLINLLIVDNKRLESGKQKIETTATHKYAYITERIEVSDNIVGYPEKHGMYAYKCNESEYEWTFAAIFERDGIMVVNESALGITPLDDFCNNLIDLTWCKVGLA